MSDYTGAFNTGSLTVTGNLAADPKFFEGKMSRCHFTVYHNWRRNEKVGDNYEMVEGKATIRCTAWGETADFIKHNSEEYFKKGSRVVVEGQIFFGKYLAEETIDLDGEEVTIEIEKESKDLNVQKIFPYTFYKKKDGEGSGETKTAARVVSRKTENADSDADSAPDTDDAPEEEAPRRRRRRAAAAE